MTEGMNTIVVPVQDLAKATALYRELLGVEPYVDQPYYVGFRAAGHEIGLDPNGHGKGLTGAVCYWNVDDINGKVKALLEAGGETAQDVTDVGGGKLIAVVKDVDGNMIGLMQ
ncbi:MAG TPA: VOC family protein [Pseudonocardiaceae bacterium]|jgi:predicted enzyme related to lactoylglutathione lyase|nr:VOC family protein [Pseudonocardiaceae bacterium]